MTLANTSREICSKFTIKLQKIKMQYQTIHILYIRQIGLSLQVFLWYTQNIKLVKLVFLLQINSIT